MISSFTFTLITTKDAHKYNINKDTSVQCPTLYKRIQTNFRLEGDPTPRSILPSKCKSVRQLFGKKYVAELTALEARVSFLVAHFADDHTAFASTHLLHDLQSTAIDCECVGD